jgi:hypothetical protein
MQFPFKFVSRSQPMTVFQMSTSPGDQNLLDLHLVKHCWIMSSTTGQGRAIMLHDRHNESSRMTVSPRTKERGMNSNIQAVIREHRKKWIEADQWEEPNLTDCLDFMATEVAEAIDKRLRTSPGYVRNTKKPAPSAREIGIEVFDAIMMGCIALDILELDLHEIAQEKLIEMDQKKGVE